MLARVILSTGTAPGDGNAVDALQLQKLSMALGLIADPASTDRQHRVESVRIKGH
jgi:hypothetical protein